MESSYAYRLVDARLLTAEQFDQIVQIEQNCGLEPFTPEMLMTCITDMDTFACFDGARVVGFITVLCHSVYCSGSLYIVNLNVAMPFRGQHIAKRLMYEVCAHYRSAAWYSLIALDVAKTNRALELYQKLGFQIVNIPSRNGDSDVVMATPLRSLENAIRKLLEAEP